MGDNLLKIYEDLKVKNPGMPAFDKFRGDMADEKVRLGVFNGLKVKNPDLPDFATFSRNMGFEAGKGGVSGGTSIKGIGEGKDFVPVLRPDSVSSGGFPGASEGAGEKGAGFWEAHMVPMMKSMGVKDVSFPASDPSYAVSRQLGDLMKTVSSGLNSAYEEIREEENRFRREHPFLHALSSAKASEDGFSTLPEFKSKRYANLSAARSLLKDSQTLISAARQENGGTFFGGLGRGFKDGVFNIDTWTMGITEGLKNTALMDAVDKADRGVKLTADEDQLLTAAALSMAVQQQYSDQLGRGYKTGYVSAESIPLMLEMIANPASGLGKGIAKSLAKYGLSKIALAGVRVTGDFVGAGVIAGTSGLPKVLSDALSRHMGQVKYAQDENGVRYAGTEGGEDWASAIGKAYGARTIENFSEMFGEYLLPVGKLIGRTKPMKMLRATKVGELASRLDNTDLARVIRDFERHAKPSDVITEYWEEQFGSLANALVIGDEKLENIASLDHQIDTLLSVVMMGGIISAVKSAGYRTQSHLAKKELSRFDLAAGKTVGSGWQSIKRDIDVSGTEDLKAVVRDILQDRSLTSGQKLCVLDYVKGKTFYESVRKIENKRDREGGTVLQASGMPDPSAAAGGGNTVESGEIQAARQPAAKQKPVPTAKAGRPDYNAMLESDPGLFASEWEKRSSAEDTQKRLSGVSEELSGKIESLVKKSDAETDFNRISDIEDEIAGLKAQKVRIDGVVAERYAKASAEVVAQQPESSRAADATGISQMAADESGGVPEAVAGGSRPLSNVSKEPDDKGNPAVVFPSGTSNKTDDLPKTFVRFRYMDGSVRYGELRGSEKGRIKVKDSKGRTYRVHPNRILGRYGSMAKLSKAMNKGKIGGEGLLDLVRKIVKDREMKRSLSRKK